MGKSAPSPPTPVDPSVVDAAQTASNQATANFQSTLNNTNQNGPYGSIQYTQNPATSQWTENTQLSPAEQSIFAQGTQAQGAALGIANNQLGNVAQALNTPLAPSGPLATGVQGGPIQGQIGGNTQQAVDQTIGSNYATQEGLLAPQQQQAAELQQAQLTAQGLNPNDAAYQNSQTLFNQGQASQQAQVANNAVNSGNTEQNLLFGQQAAQGQFANSAQSQAFGEGSTNANLYNAANQQQFSNSAYAQQLPINEFNSLMSSGQVNAPTSTPSQTSVAPTNDLGAYSLQATQQQNAYQAQLQQYQSGLGGLFNLGSAALGAAGNAGGIGALFSMSDERLKSDIEPTGGTYADFPLYDFRYNHEPEGTHHIGVMAQDVARWRPDAIGVHPSGYMGVDYSRLAA